MKLVLLWLLGVPAGVGLLLAGSSLDTERAWARGLDTVAALAGDAAVTPAPRQHPPGPPPGEAASPRAAPRGAP